MAREIDQESFIPVSFSHGGRLNVHRQKSTNNIANTLLIFIHGLQGSAYETWGKFPDLSFSNLEQPCHIGIFTYPSGLKRMAYRLRRGKTPRLERVAATLADELQETDYANVVLIGHSMGCKIAESSLRILEKKGHRKICSTNFSLFLFAGPRAGSKRASRLLPQQDIRYLSIHNTTVTNDADFYNAKVDKTLDKSYISDRIRIPVFVGQADADAWVDEFSSSYAVPPQQVRTFSANHSSLVKPEDSESEVYRWFTRKLRVIDDFHKTRDRERKDTSSSLHTFSEDSIVTRFCGHPLETKWEHAYRQAKTDFEAVNEVPIRDVYQVSPSVIPELLLRIVRSNEVDNEKVLTELIDDHKIQVQQTATCLGISPHGSDHGDASTKIYEHIGQGPSGSRRWIKGTATTAELADTLLNWFTWVYEDRLKKDQLLTKPELRNKALLDEELTRRDVGTLGGGVNLL